MRDVMTVAHLTLVEARRRRIVLAGAVCALAFLVVFSVAVVFAYREMAADASVSFIERQGTLTAIMLVGFMAANFLAVIFAILLPIDTLSGEIDSGGADARVEADRSRADRARQVGGPSAAGVRLSAARVRGHSPRDARVAGLAPAGVPRAIPLLMLEITPRSPSPWLAARGSAP